MPSFLEGLGRLIKGEPVFRQGEGVDGVEYKAEQRMAERQAAEEAATTPVDAIEKPGSGTKIIPMVYIDRVEYRPDAQGMQVDVEIKNASDRDVMVDRINILGTTYQINRLYAPGEEREVNVYNGPRPNHRNYTSCEVQYRDQATGDYFASLHLVEFEQESDNTYVIKRIRFTPPIKDI